MENGDALYARIAELEKENAKLKEKTKEYEAVECFIMKTWSSSNYDRDVALYAHYREGKVIDGEWVNNENSDEDNDEDSEEEEEVLEDLTCDQLRNRLRDMNKPVSGCKARLIKRIRDHEQLTAALFEED